MLNTENTRAWQRLTVQMIINFKTVVFSLNFCAWQYVDTVGRNCVLVTLRNKKFKLWNSDYLCFTLGLNLGFFNPASPLFLPQSRHSTSFDPAGLVREWLRGPCKSRVARDFFQRCVIFRFSSRIPPSILRLSRIPSLKINMNPFSRRNIFIPHPAIESPVNPYPDKSMLGLFLWAAGLD